MSAVSETRTRLTVAEYLAIENAAETKSEFFDGEMFVMSGAMPEHNGAKENLVGEMFSQLKSGPCRSFSSDQRVRIDPTGLYTYPDIVIVCGKPEYALEDRATLLNPQVIFEVLSEATEDYDRGVKWLHYQQLLSLREYVLVSAREMRIERYVRQPDGSWLLTFFTDPDREFALSTVPVRMPLREVYAGVEFPPANALKPRRKPRRKRG